MQNQEHIMLILDLTVQIEGIQEFYQNLFKNITESSKMFFNTISFLSPKGKEPHYSIITIEDTFFNVLYDQDKFDLIKIHNVLNRLKPSGIFQNKEKFNSIEVSVSHSIQKKVQKMILITSFENKITTRLQEQLQKCQSNIEFHILKLKLPSNGLGRSNLVQNFSQFPNVTEIIVPNDSYLIQNQILQVCKGNYQVTKDFEIILPDSTVIKCITELECIEKMKISSEMICSCHYKSINKMKEKYCSIDGVELTNKQMMECLSIGSSTFPISFKNPNINLKFKMIKKIDISSMSESLLIGNPIILVPSLSFAKMEDMFGNDHLFSATSLYLEKNNIGMIVVNESFLNEYYLIVGEKNGNSIMMRKISCKEEYMEIQKRKVNFDQNVSKKVDQMMDEMMEISDYFPMEYSSGIHEKLNEYFKTNLLKKNK